MVASRPAFPRSADANEPRAAAPNPVAELRGALEEAATKPDSFHSVVDKFPDAAERFSAEPPSAHPPGWRPEAFEPIGDKSGGSSRKRMLLLGGAAAVLVVGVAVTLTMRGGSTGGNAPTIRASNEPFKIQPEAKPAGAKPSETASILDRNGSERLAASRVVTREEQPVDVREAARQAAAANRPSPNAGANAGPNAGAPPSGLPTAGPAANNFFPEPRRVRTVSVRPDGTIISEAPQPAAAPSSAPRAAAPAPSRPAAAPPAAPAPAAPQTAAPAPVRVAAAPPPKTPERAGPTTTATASPSATPQAAAARTASPQSSAVAATPRSGGGAFAVQLGTGGSESEARAAIARLQQRYGSALGGLQPTVRKATVGERDVFRIRLVGLSQSDANGVCEKLKSAGGSCFVARE
jgi:hypothetical protein